MPPPNRNPPFEQNLSEKRVAGELPNQSVRLPDERLCLHHAFSADAPAAGAAVKADFNVADALEKVKQVIVVAQLIIAPEDPFL